MTAQERYAWYQEQAWMWRLSDEIFMEMKDHWPRTQWQAEYDRRYLIRPASFNPLSEELLRPAP